jgi:hypothetical protein
MTNRFIVGVVIDCTNPTKKKKISKRIPTALCMTDDR